jgi:uncharacterized protein YaaR (DUF327 family)
MGMKIGKLDVPTQAITTGLDSGRHVEKTETYFSSDLHKQQSKLSMERLQKLFTEIEESGKRLSSTPTYLELKKYKDLVKSFVGEAVGNMYEFESKNAWDRRGRQKVFSIIKKVDDTLAEMTEDVRVGQEKQLDIMEKHGIIRGLLIDLFT